MSFAQNFEAMSWSEVLRRYDVDRADKIHFQEGSTWLFSMSSSLCTDGTFIYGGASIQAQGAQVVDLVQPIVSTYQRCAQFSGESCDRYETIVYRQSPQRMINILSRGTSQNANIIGTKSYRIPDC